MTVEASTVGVSKEHATPPLRATLEVTLPPEAACSLTHINSSVTSVKRETKSAGPGVASTKEKQCHKAISVKSTDGSTQRRYEKSQIDSTCVCDIFDGFDCVATIDGVRNGTLIITVIVPDRRILRDVVTRLQQEVQTVSMQRIIREGDDGMDNVEITTGGITEKQREALRVATELGYYESPRRTDLSSLADELDISKSAVSQRLNAVESKLVRALVDQECEGWEFGTR